MKSPANNAVFISDLHLLSPRSVFDLNPLWIVHQYSHSELLVLGGDIFDFRWSTLGSTKASLAAAEMWLRQLIDNWTGRMIYLPGNHDSHPEFLQLLDSLQSETSAFSWEPHAVRLGTTLCLHGDLYDAGSEAGLMKYRAQFHHNKAQPALVQSAYNAAVTAQVHRVIPWLRNRRDKVCRKLCHQLKDMQMGTNGINTVIFGHTHHRIDGRDVADIRFYNPGAALRYSAFQPVEFRVE